MKVMSATVALPVRDLQQAENWYRRVFELSEPALSPAPQRARHRTQPAGACAGRGGLFDFRDTDGNTRGVCSLAL